MIGGPYSFVVFEAGLLIVVGLILLTRMPKWNDYLAFGVVATGLISAFIALHPRATNLPEDALLVQQIIGAGKPVLLEFQSPY